MRAAIASAMLLCLSSAAPGAADEARPVDLRLGEAHTLAADSLGDVLLVWQAVDDSRCPLNLTCIWEGEVAVHVDVRIGAADTESITLTRHDDTDERATAEVAGVRLRLVGVDPYPVGENPPAAADYVAHLLVALPGEGFPADTAVGPRSWAQVKRSEDR